LNCYNKTNQQTDRWTDRWMDGWTGWILYIQKTTTLFAGV